MDRKQIVEATPVNKPRSDSPAPWSSQGRKISVPKYTSEPHLPTIDENSWYDCEKIVVSKKNNTTLKYYTNLYFFFVLLDICLRFVKFSENLFVKLFHKKIDIFKVIPT